MPARSFWNAEVAGKHRGQDFSILDSVLPFQSCSLFHAEGRQVVIVLVTKLAQINALGGGQMQFEHVSTVY